MTDKPTEEELTIAIRRYIAAVVWAESVDFIEYMDYGRSRDIIEAMRDMGPVSNDTPGITGPGCHSVGYVYPDGTILGEADD